MNDDPIVAEVRQVRDKLARQFDYDIHAIFADLRMREGTNDPAHPLMTDAMSSVPVGESSPVLRDEPWPDK